MLKKDGAAMLEAAVVLPLMLFVVAALIFLPLTIFFNKTIAVDAARAGARHVALWNDEAGAKDLVEGILAENGLDLDKLEEVLFDYSTDNYVKVTVKYRQTVMSPRIPELLGGDALGDFFLLSVSSTFKREGPL